MVGGDLGKSSNLKRPETACHTFIHMIELELVEDCIASMTTGKAWPLAEGDGSACDRILIASEVLCWYTMFTSASQHDHDQGHVVHLRMDPSASPSHGAFAELYGELG